MTSSYRTKPNEVPFKLDVFDRYTGRTYSMEFRYQSSLNYYLRSKLDGNPGEQYPDSGSQTARDGRQYTWRYEK